MVALYLPTREKILLHLEELVYIREQIESPTLGRIEVPRTLSREGIAKAVRISQSRLSRLMKKFVDDGYVSEILAYIDDDKERKRTAYFLSHEGSYRAKKIKEKVGNMIIAIRVDNCKTRDMKLSDVVEYLKERGHQTKILTHLDIINYTSADGIFDPKAVVETTEGPKYIEFAERVPELKYFFGRKKELEFVSNWMKSDTEKIMVINGIAGIGKTTFLTKISEEYKGKCNLFYYRFHEWSTLKNIVESLSHFLSKMGKKTLERYCKLKTKLDITEIALILEDLLGECDALLIFDDYHKVEEELVQFSMALVGVLEHIDGVKIIISGRHVPQFYDRRDVRVKKLIVEMELKGLDEESSEELMRLRKLKETDFEKIYELTRGHPLCLELIESGDIDTQHITKFIKEEVLSKLTDEEKRVLSIASVFRFPFHSKAFFMRDRMKTMKRERLFESREYAPEKMTSEEKEVHFDIIDRLVDKSLLQISGGLYDVHDLIRQFFYGRLTPLLKAKYHEKAAEYYLQERGYQNYIESQYHSFRAGKHEEATKQLTSRGETLINNGYAKELMSVLEIIVGEESEISKEGKNDVLVMLGTISELIGEYEKSIGYYKTALKACEEQLKTAKINMKMGSLLEKKGDFDGALKSYEHGLKYTSESRKFVETGQLFGNIGCIYLRKGEYENAERYILKGIKIIKEIGNEKVLGLEYQMLGTLHSQRGNYSLATQYYKKSLKIIEKLGNQQEKGILYNNIGTTYHCQGNFDTALELFEKGLKIREKIGDQRGIMASLSNIGIVHYSKGEYDVALSFYERALNIAEEIGDHLGISTSSLNIGNILFNKGDYDSAMEYYEKSLKIKERLDTKKGLSYIYHNMGCINLMREMYVNAIKDYEKSLEICKNNNDKLFLVLNYCGIADVNVRMKKLREALRFCNLAYDISREIEAKESQGWCLRIFGMIHREERKWAESTKNFEKSIEIFKKIGHKMELGHTFHEYGLMRMAKGEKKKSEKYLKEALKIFEELGVKGEIEKIKKIRLMNSKVFVKQVKK